MGTTICPKCKSEDVRKEMNVLLAAGAPQKWICNKCGYNGYIFPVKEKLNKTAKLKK